MCSSTVVCPGAWCNTTSCPLQQQIDKLKNKVEDLERKVESLILGVNLIGGRNNERTF